MTKDGEPQDDRSNASRTEVVLRCTYFWMITPYVEKMISITKMGTDRTLQWCLRMKQRRRGDKRSSIRRHAPLRPHPLVLLLPPRSLGLPRCGTREAPILALDMGACRHL